MKKMRKFKEGQKVYWNDPAGETSGIYEVLDPKDDYNSEVTEEDIEDFDERMILIGNDFGEAEVYAGELEIINEPDNVMETKIKIAVLCFDTSDVDIITVDKSFIDENFGGDIEAFLTEHCQYNLDNVQWMAGENINLNLDMTKESFG